MCSLGVVYLGKHLHLLLIFGVGGGRVKRERQTERRIHRESFMKTTRKTRGCTYCCAVAELVLVFRTVVALSDVRIVYVLFVY